MAIIELFNYFAIKLFKSQFNFLNIIGDAIEFV